MAASGFSPVYIYASGTTGNIPSASNLTNTSNGSEIALNYFDGKLFYKNASNSVVTVPLLQSSGSQNGWLSSTDWTTFNNKQAALVSGTNIKTVGGVSLLGSGDVGTIGVGYGGTGSTSWTANGVLYASSTNTLTNGTGILFDGTNLTIGTSTSQAVVGSSKLTVNNGISASDGTSIVQLLGQTNYEGLYFKASYLRVYNDSGTGVYLQSGATSWTASSDANLKNVINNISNGLELVKQLNPIVYTWKNDETNTKKLGFIAQQMQAIIPEVVDNGPEGYLGIRYSDLVPVLVSAIKEINEKLKAAQVAGF